ncbi:serine protease [Streptomyces triticagri]|uniref:Serine protease n=1 Tax=Streptomyces triticagri TaxID=2293568 RepID=A0A372M5J9_9ACTN|nr:serpin family protein [Streptomyces triticagri]RFU86222.1 serine protease [Streptomyces triticagri]
MTEEQRSGRVAPGAAAAWPPEAVRTLAERWLPGVAEGEGDFVCSPAGLWLALAAVAAGSRGETAAEFEQLLEVAGDTAADAVTAASRALAETDALEVATGVWSAVPVYRAYREALPDVGFGPLDPPRIDGWVREATGGLIERLPVELSAGTLLVLVNALALKARWDEPFSGTSTHSRPFTDVRGQVHQVPTMHRSVPLADAWRIDGTRVVELRCRGGAAPARVRFVLGRPGQPAHEVLPAAWAPGALRAALDAEQVVMALPRLALRTRIEAADQIRALGVRTAFRNGADLSGISPEPLAISDVVQESVLRIAEEGVEAAAATAVPARAGSAYRPVRVERVAYDRPFGVVVLGGEDVPLFVAWQAGAPDGAAETPRTSEHRPA